MKSRLTLFFVLLALAVMSVSASALPKARVVDSPDAPATDPPSAPPPPAAVQEWWDTPPGWHQGKLPQDVPVCQDCSATATQDAAGVNKFTYTVRADSVFAGATISSVTLVATDYGATEATINGTLSWAAQGNMTSIKTASGASGTIYMASVGASPATTKLSTVGTVSRSPTRWASYGATAGKVALRIDVKYTSGGVSYLGHLGLAVNVK